MVFVATHAPPSIKFTLLTPVNQSGLGATIITSETMGCAESTCTEPTRESANSRRGPVWKSGPAVPAAVAALISASSGSCFPCSESRSRPGVGELPSAKMAYDALCAAPIVPEKCGPETGFDDGYSNG